MPVPCFNTQSQIQPSAVLPVEMNRALATLARIQLGYPGDNPKCNSLGPCVGLDMSCPALHSLPFPPNSSLRSITIISLGQYAVPWTIRQFDRRRAFGKPHHCSAGCTCSEQGWQRRVHNDPGK